MESQLQQQEYTDTQNIKVSAPGTMVTIEPNTEDKWTEVGSQVSGFLAQLPEIIGNFWESYKQPITSLGLIFAAIITVKVVLAVIDALNDIPLLAPTFELIGIAYSAWFINRYLLQASNRQELAQEIEKLKGKVVGSQQV
ncbi:CAAD domain-containing protein [Synechocystis sp. PCC 7509]|uniref:CAAD domain-containing protein n=1 Tax=Synechocystis sp. PCC 7509 TaxID=927677 RepID=UPI0002AC283A|nr:CAAD domain-containing protein [Synechocystis sp. PCC 7509]